MKVEYTNNMIKVEDCDLSAVLNNNNTIRISIEHSLITVLDAKNLKTIIDCIYTYMIDKNIDTNGIELEINNEYTLIPGTGDINNHRYVNSSTLEPIIFLDRMGGEDIIHIFNKFAPCIYNHELNSLVKVLNKLYMIINRRRL